MKIYRYWAKSEINVSGIVYHFKAGSNNSTQDALLNVQKRIENFQKYSSGELDPFEREENYESEICEELVETIDERNLVTRNRYGALVLNSEDLLFLDIDDAPLSFGSWVGSLFGGSKKTNKERILERISKLVKSAEFNNTGFRIYETCRGIRLLFSLPAKECIASGKVIKLAKLFSADELYTILCMKQQCCRARLTPKPARIGVKTMLKFTFPCERRDVSAYKEWLANYEKESRRYNVCRLLKQIGPQFSSPALEYHDRMTGVNGNLPLA